MHDLLVVGAGISALTCCSEILRVHPHWDILVLEARDRIAGRLHTHYGKYTGIELGANWVHGTEGNPLMNLIQKHNIREKLTLVQDLPDSLWRNPDPDLQKYVLLSDDGVEQLVSHEHVQRAFTLYKRIMDYLKKQVWRDECLSENEEKVLQDDAKKAFANAVAHFSQREQLITELDCKILNWYLYLIESWMGCDLEDMDPMSCFAGFESWGDCPGPHWNIKEGYSQVVDLLAKSYGVNISTNVNVVSIERVDGHVVVQDSNGKEYQAKKVLVTVPLNVLKSSSIAFKPELSLEKRTAMSRVEMTHYRKVFLFFSTAFWISIIPKDVKYFVILASLKDCTLNWGKFWTWNIKPQQEGYILSSAVIGKLGAQVDLLSAEDVLQLAMEVLRARFKCVPEPEDYILSNWNQEEFSKGAYAINPKDSAPEDIDLIASNIDDGIFFAGDACDGEHLGSVSAAIISAEKAACAIVKST